MSKPSISSVSSVAEKICKHLQKFFSKEKAQEVSKQVTDIFWFPRVLYIPEEEVLSWMLDEDDTRTVEQIFDENWEDWQQKTDFSTIISTYATQEIASRTNLGTDKIKKALDYLNKNALLNCRPLLDESYLYRCNLFVNNNESDYALLDYLNGEIYDVYEDNGKSSYNWLLLTQGYTMSDFLHSGNPLLCDQEKRKNSKFLGSFRNTLEDLGDGIPSFCVSLNIRQLSRLKNNKTLILPKDTTCGIFQINIGHGFFDIILEKPITISKNVLQNDFKETWFQIESDKDINADYPVGKENLSGQWTPVISDGSVKDVIVPQPFTDKEVAELQKISEEQLVRKDQLLKP